MKLMVFDVGGTEIKYAVMDEKFNRYDSGYIPTPHDSFEHFSAVIKEIYEAHRTETDGIAMSLPGFIDTDRGIVLGGSPLRYNWKRPVGPQLEEICGCPVVLENDGKAAVMAEFSSGVLQGCSNAAVFVIGTGVGGGLVINGQIIRGKNFKAGEFSFVNTESEKFSELEGYLGTRCSTTALLTDYKMAKGFEEDIDGREFFRRLPDDKTAQNVLDGFAREVAKQIYNLHWLLDLEKVAIGGGISRQPVLIERINEQLKELIKIHPWPKVAENTRVEIVQAKYGNDANLIGAFMTYLSRK